jgi:hypothetical protein
MSGQALKRVRRAVGLTVCREALPAYAWPGGYPVYYLAADGEVICPECANANLAQIDGAIKAGPRSGWDDWRLVASDVNYEDAHMTCAHCNKGIPCAYLSEEEWENVRNLEPETPDDEREHETDGATDGAPVG